MVDIMLQKAKFCCFLFLCVRFLIGRLLKDKCHDFFISVVRKKLVLQCKLGTNG